MPNSAENGQTLATLTANMETVTRSLSEFKEEFRAFNKSNTELLVQIVELKTTLSGVSKDMDELTKVVRTGNGQPSLLTRLAQLETSHEGVSRSVIDMNARLTALTQLETSHSNYVKEVDELKKQLGVVATSKMLTRGQIVSGLIGLVITAVLALGAILSQLMRS